MSSTIPKDGAPKDRTPDIPVRYREEGTHVLQRKSDSRYFGYGSKPYPSFFRWVSDIEDAVHLSEHSATDNAQGNVKWRAVLLVPSKHK